MLFAIVVGYTWIPADAFEIYTKLVGGVFDNNTAGLLRIDDPTKLQNLHYTIGDVRRPNLIFLDNSNF